MGPRVRKVAEVAWPRPWIVPSTLGWGELLLMRMMVAGSANVRAATWRKRTTLMPSQMMEPLAGSGGGEEEGRRAM